MDTENLLRQGIAAAKAGQRLEARQVLMRVVKADQRNEQAWIWLAAVVDDPAHQRTCLEYALKLNPQNVQAKQGIAWIDKHYPPPAPTPALTPVPKPSSTPSAKSASTPPDQPPPREPQQPASVDEQPASSIPVASVSTVHEATHTQPQTDEQPPSLRHNEAAPAGSGSLRSRIHSARSGTSPQHAAPLQTPGHTAVSPLQAPTIADASAVTSTSTPESTLSPYICPFCGTTTKPEARTCPQCSKALYIRAAPPERRSVALSFLGGVWGIISIFTIGVNFIWIGHDAKFILPLSGGIISLGIAVGLLRRYRWAYSIVIVVTIGLTILSLMHHFWPLMLPLYILLPRSYGDFYGKKERFVPQLSTGSHQSHHEAGQAYRKQEMWYMASREWERAVAAQPENVTYSQALALAYARLHQYDKALSLLRDLLKRRPDDARIQEIVRTIEDMASKQR